MAATDLAAPVRSRSFHLPWPPLWHWAVLILLLLEIAQVWRLDYFPSEDGPSHLYNAAVLADYSSQPAYREYYLVTPFTPAGNLLTQFILAGLLKIVGFAAAEKVLLTFYFVLFVASFCYLLRAIAPEAAEFTVFSAVVASNYFLFMGFWNFCFSLIVLMSVLGWYLHRLRRDAPWTPVSLVEWTLAGGLLYLTHSVSLIVCIIGVAAIAIAELGLALFTTADRCSVASIRRTITRHAAPIFCISAPLILILTHLPRSGAQMPVPRPESLASRLWTVYSLSFLHTVSAADPALAKAVAGVIAFAFITGLVVFLRYRQWNWRWTGLLLAAAICASLAVFGPDAVGTGSYIHLRVAFCAMLFFVLWIASVVPRWPPACLNITAALLLLIGILTIVVRDPVLSLWSHRLSAVVRLGRAVRPGTTILPLMLERDPRFEPMLHSVDLLSPRGIVDLANYEASVDYFTTKFQPERSPFPRLGTIHQLSSAPPVFNIAAYETNTRGHVDYLLVLNATPRNAQELRLFPEQMAAFALIGSDESDTIRLYARRRMAP